MIVDPTLVCELLVGLGDVTVLGTEDQPGGPVRVHVQTRSERPACPGFGGLAWSKDQRPVEVVDLAAFGRPARLVWHKFRRSCTVVSFGSASPPSLTWLPPNRGDRSAGGPSDIGVRGLDQPVRFTAARRADTRSVEPSGAAGRMFARLAQPAGALAASTLVPIDHVVGPTVRIALPCGVWSHAGTS